MNLPKLRGYLSEYKNRFDDISSQEIYKWRGIKQFQSVWDPNSPDFASMLKDALSKTSNLMDTSMYFPRAMIGELADHHPQRVRSAFLRLYDESTDYLPRIAAFRSELDALHAESGAGKSSYQDVRAVFVYLTLRYPETYFFYKFGMLNKSCKLLEVPYAPLRGHEENLVVHMQLCEQVREVIRQDQEFLGMSAKRIGQLEYVDPAHTVLTQDVIYAITTHLQMAGDATPASTSIEISFSDVPDVLTPEPRIATPSHVDYDRRQRIARQIGSLGESHLFRWAANEFGTENVEHTSVAKGDGAGYDLRVMHNDKEIFIEVKTTTGGKGTPFEITRNELEFSRANPEAYQLFRLYNFDADSETAECYVIKGSLEKYCTLPSAYTVHLGST